MHPERQVVIVGAGPVGLSAALFLRQRNVSVTVIEAEHELQTDMRASTFHPPTLDMLSSSGIADVLIRQGTQVPQWQYRRHETGERVVFDMSVLADVTRHPFRLQCEQFRLTRAISEHLSDDTGFELIMGATVTSLSQDERGVTLGYESSGGTGAVSASFAVAADGSKSTIRKSLDLPFRGETYPSMSITVVLDCPFEELIPGLLPVNYCWARDYRFSLMRVGKHWRTGYSPVDGQTVEEALSDDYIAYHVGIVAGRDVPFKIEHRGAYAVHRCVLDSFRHGRVLFAGDSAHLNSPSGGMGMNSGIHDAYVLATSLSAVLNGEPETRLDEYARQRREVALVDVQAASDRHHRMHRERDRDRRDRNWEVIRQTAADREGTRQYLLKASMIASLLRYGIVPATLE